MSRGVHPKGRRILAWGAILALLALSFLFVVPHSWHKEDGKRACAICQAWRTPSAPPQPGVQIEPPAVITIARGEPVLGAEARSERAIDSCRAPPFRIVPS